MAATGQWINLGGGAFKRFIPSAQMTGSGSWETVRGLDAVKYGLISPNQLTGMDKMKYDTNSNYRQQVDAAAQGGSGGVGGATRATSNPYKDILAQAQAEQDKANAANEVRYQQALGISDQMLSTSEGMGQQERADIGTHNGERGKPGDAGPDFPWALGLYSSPSADDEPGEEHRVCRGGLE